MTFLPYVLQLLATCILSWMLWRAVRALFAKSPLDIIPGPSNTSFVYGNFGEKLQNKNGWDFIQHLTDSYEGVTRLYGFFGNRILYVFDPLALHNIIVKDQNVYEESRWFQRSMYLALGPGLLATLGEQHRRQRKMLNPVFSIAHMRQIHAIFVQIGHKLVTAIEGNVGTSTIPVEIDMLSWMGRTALELIGQAGLGYSFDPLIRDSPDEFAMALKSLQPSLNDIIFLRRFLPILCQIGSASFRRKIVEMVPSRRVQRMKMVSDTLHRRSVEIYEEKKRALDAGDEAVKRQVGAGKDIMSILLRANTAAAEEDRLPEDEVIGQMSTLITAAMDTTSNALSVILQLLAQHPEVQDKLRNELLAASQDGDIDYDALNSLPYLDAVCRETLRLHPPISYQFREPRQDMVLPLSKPIRATDGTMISEVPVPKDTLIVIGILSSNRNKALWGEDAMEWKPERWLSPLPEAVMEAKIPGVYSHLMTFLGGGRSCIGFKFSQLEMKVVLSLLISKFTFGPSDKSISWCLSGIRFPTVPGVDGPCMPLMVGLHKAGGHSQ